MPGRIFLSLALVLLLGSLAFAPLRANDETVLTTTMQNSDVPTTTLVGMPIR